MVKKDVFLTCKFISYKFAINYKLINNKYY